MTTVIVSVVVAVVGFICALVSLGSGNPTTGTAPTWAFYAFIGSLVGVIGGVAGGLIAAWRMAGWMG